MVGNGFARNPRGTSGLRINKRADAASVVVGGAGHLGMTLILLLGLAACAGPEGDAKGQEAAVASPASPAAPEGTPGAGGPPMMAPRSLDISPYVAEVDADGDGCMSHEEWVVKAGAPLSSYDMLKNEQGCVTFERMFNESAPGGIDADGDGRLTLAEMLEFDKKMAPLMEGREPPPR